MLFLMENAHCATTGDTEQNGAKHFTVARRAIVTCFRRVTIVFVKNLEDLQSFFFPSKNSTKHPCKRSKLTKNTRTVLTFSTHSSLLAQRVLSQTTVVVAPLKSSQALQNKGKQLRLLQTVKHCSKLPTGTNHLKLQKNYTGKQSGTEENSVSHQNTTGQSTGFLHPPTTQKRSEVPGGDPLNSTRKLLQ